MSTTSTTNPRSLAGGGSWGFVATAIAVLTGIAAGVIHFSLVTDEFNKGATGYGTAFILTGVATFAGLIAGYVPLAALAPLRTVARVALILLSIGSIVAYLVLGYFDTLGWITKAIETFFVLGVAATIAVDAKSS